jgi:hypothetical protein
MITALERTVRWIEDNLPTLRAASWAEEITDQVNANIILSGTGSPENVVTANQLTLYMDDAGTAGSILYIKKSGTDDTGWILV